MLVGKGWKLSVQQTVVAEIIDSETFHVYNDSDGTEHYFVQVNGIYVDEDGMGLTLTVNDDGYVIENEYGNKYSFGTDGKITYTYDEFERLVQKTHSSDVYTSRYSYVTDADGNTSSLVSQLDIDTNTSDACYTYAYNNLGFVWWFYCRNRL